MFKILFTLGAVGVVASAGNNSKSLDSSALRAGTLAPAPMIGAAEEVGVRDWPWFARGAGVRDSAAFLQCIEEGRGPEMVDKGIAVGDKMGVRATPVVFLNGWRYPGVPPEAEFLQAVDELVAGRRPFDGFPDAAINARR